jgi:hypothetical protein
LSDTEDWRSFAHIGNRKSAVSNMNIVEPSTSSYLKEAAKRKMSFSREKSLKRAISYRAVLVTPKGTIAESQYNDQYLDRQVVMETLKEQHKVQQKRMSIANKEADALVARGITSLSEELSKCATSSH